jgi:diguanylate cyclase (GGDEF)-like protein
LYETSKNLTTLVTLLRLSTEFGTRALMFLSLCSIGDTVKSGRRDETRWSDLTALVAAFVALPVSIGAGAVVLTLGNLNNVAGGIYIAVPGLIAALATAAATYTLLIRRHRSRERGSNRRLSTAKRELQDEKQERAVLRELDSAIDLAPDERAATDLIRESFARHLSMQPMELHLVDTVDPVLELVVATGELSSAPAQRTSPWDSLAARSDRTLVYDTTDRLDVCPHLKSRVHTPMSAVAVPISATGSLLGVLYAFGPEGQEAGVGDIRFLEDLAKLIGARIAILRASAATSVTPDEVDRLTGIPDRASMQERVLRLLRERQAFTVAVADIDAFGQFNELEGRNAGDRALKLLSRVARAAVRPGDMVGRIGGDEFLFVLPQTKSEDAARAFERLREALVLEQSLVGDPPFTLSIGVIGSGSGGTIEEILQRAAGALDHARTQGGNRVIVAQTTRQAPSAG